MWIIIMAFVLPTGPLNAVWSDNGRDFAVYTTEAACTKQVAKIEKFIVKTGGADIPHFIGCKKVEEVPQRRDKLDSGNT